MARPLRVQAAGAHYHVGARGINKAPVFLSDEDRERFLVLLDDVVARYGWRCHAYCLMPNHYHLLIETTEANLSKGMHRLNFRYAVAFNRRYDLTGHVYERRFHSEPIESEEHLFEAARYIVLNPVRAKICSHPGLWRWSSYAPTVGRRRSKLVSVERFASFFGPDPAVYAAYVAEAISA